MVVARHQVVEFFGCPAERVDDAALVRRAARALCRDAGLHVVRRLAYRFAPHGLTFVCILRESHLAYSSWPEHRFAVLDLFLCGEPKSLAPAVAAFGRALGARRWRRRALAVGR